MISFRKTVACLCALVLTACQGDETASAYGAADKTWILQEINDEAVQGRATLVFPDPGTITGELACNSYSATMTVPYPWFGTGPVATTRRQCPQSDAETLYLSTLAAMTLIEVLGDTLILTNDNGDSMVFTAGD